MNALPLRMIETTLVVLVVIELVAWFSIWGVLWIRYRRPGIAWFRVFERARPGFVLAWKQENFVPAGWPLRRVGNIVQWALGGTLLAAVLVAAAQGKLFDIPR